MNTDEIMALVEAYRTAGGREEHWARQDHLRTAVEALVADTRAAALEEAADICDRVNNYDNPMTAGDCADAIRALKEKT